MVELGTNEKGSGRLSFAEIVGQKELKESLQAVVVDDDLDGLLVRGEKGTAKSTTVRALADLLPTQEVVEDCPYGCPPSGSPQCVDCRERSDPPVAERPVPLVTLPLGATRERVVGSLSVADALDGRYDFEPGLLARANRGILYVDEVNLLDDHLVDVVLDAAASGVNRVEREGVSVSHPAEFTLVGTMNPEEGELRPQLRDRFALQATVTGCEDIDKRVAIINRAIDRDDSEPEGDSTSEEQLRERIVRARNLLGEVTLAEEYAVDIADLCRSAGLDGHRGDIAIARCARAFAALDGRTTVIESDVSRAAELALPHRMASRPFEEEQTPDDITEEFFDQDETGESETDRGEQQESAGEGEEGRDGADQSEGENGGPGETSEAEPDEKDTGDEDEQSQSARQPDDSSSDRGNDGPGRGNVEDSRGEGREPEEQDEEQASDADDEATPLVPGQSREAADIGESSSPEVPVPETETVADSNASGRGEAAPSTAGRGPRVRTETADGTGDIDAVASVHAAARRGESTVQSRDLRQSVRTTDASTLVVFAVDASASMRPAMRTAKGTVLELLKDAYQQRDEVAFVAFAGEDAEVLLPPTDSVTLAARHLKELPTGDRTPLPAGLETAATVLDRANPETALVVVVTDGKANVGENPVAATREGADALARRDADVLVVNADTGERTSLVDAIVERTDGRCVPLERLSAGRVDAAVGSAGRPDS